jgi:hypothetical protein
MGTQCRENVLGKEATPGIFLKFWKSSTIYIAFRSPERKSEYPLTSGFTILYDCLCGAEILPAGPAPMTPV